MERDRYLLVSMPFVGRAKGVGVGDLRAIGVGVGDREREPR